jgi:hypothetical protein
VYSLIWGPQSLYVSYKCQLLHRCQQVGARPGAEANPGLLTSQGLSLALDGRVMTHNARVFLRRGEPALRFDVNVPVR